jgi:hypothetical protein
MAFRMWKCFFVILQVRISVAGASQETRLESHPPYNLSVGLLMHTGSESDVTREYRSYILYPVASV